MRYFCRFTGCPAAFVHEWALERHEMEPHVFCTCGRMFTTPRGIAAHRRQVERRGHEHPRFGYRYAHEREAAL